MDIGEEIERITVEPLEEPIPGVEPAPVERPETDVKPEREPIPVRNLLTAPSARGEQVTVIARPPSLGS